MIIKHSFVHVDEELYLCCCLVFIDTFIVENAALKQLLQSSLKSEVYAVYVLELFVDRMSLTI